MKKVLIITGIIIGAIILIRAFLVLLAVTGAFSIFTPNPPKPEIKYGEFPFRLEYELNGELKVIEDTIICEFDGFESLGTAGKYRVWKTYLKSGNERIILLDFRSVDEINELGRKMIALYFFYGSGEYYMDDEYDFRKRAGNDISKVSYIYQYSAEEIRYASYTAEEAFERYGIKLISWEPSEPIVNSYK